MATEKIRIIEKEIFAENFEHIKGCISGKLRRRTNIEIVNSFQSTNKMDGIRKRRL